MHSMVRTFRNPIIPGFYPDPSICRVGEDYYLVTSTFEYFPGVPIFHSRDLVHWQQIGHVLDRPSQLDLDGIRPSGGIYAPTVRHHDGVFYMITTNVGKGGNFIVTAADPAGPWSDPYWLEDAPGIDPSLLFDDIDGLYYLMIAEGGTHHDHAVTIARSESVTGPYAGNPRNPILTHRHLGLDYPIVNTGHADMVQTQNGEWWLVCLASRPYGGYHRNLGRETFLVPVRWEEGWPVVSPGSGRIEFSYPAPDVPEHRWPAPPACDNFDAPELASHWNLLRTPRERFWSLRERPGHLRLHLRPEMISKWENPSFVGRRQQHLSFAARTVVEFTPRAGNEEAGVVLLQNSDFQFRFVYTLADDRTVIRLIRRCEGQETVMAQKP